MPLKSEINPLPLLRKLAAAGAKLALPAIAGRGKPLIMRAYTFGDELARGQWGIREPKPEARAVDPDILIVPLACFDRAGHRIGYRRRLLRHDHQRAARQESRHRHRHRLRRPGNRRRFRRRSATRASISC